MSASKCWGQQSAEWLWEVLGMPLTSQPGGKVATGSRSTMRGWTQGRLNPLGPIVEKEEAHPERKSHEMWGTASGSELNQLPKRKRSGGLWEVSSVHRAVCPLSLILMLLILYCNDSAAASVVT